MDTVPVLQKTIYLLHETNSRVSDSVHVRVQLSHGKSGVHILITEKGNNPTENNRSAGKYSPLSTDNSLFIIHHFPLIHKFPDDGDISLTWCLDSRKKGVERVWLLVI